MCVWGGGGGGGGGGGVFESQSVPASFPGSLSTAHF